MKQGVNNFVVFQKIFKIYRKEILQSRLLMVEGKLQREGVVVHVIVQRCFDLTKLLRKLTSSDKEDLPLLTLSRADEKDGSAFQNGNKKTQVREIAEEEIFPKGRNFK